MLSDNWETIARIEVATEGMKLKTAVVNSVLSFKAKKIDQMIAENQLKIKGKTNEKEFEEIQELLKKQQELKGISKQINLQLGRVITR
ncbi:MAG: hypothetical protein R2750_05575 [Bacteroidales bacterium]